LQISEDLTAPLQNLHLESCDGLHIGWYDFKITGFIETTSVTFSKVQQFKVQVISNNAQIWVPDVYDEVTYKYSLAGSSKSFDKFYVESPGYEDATWEYQIYFETDASSLDPSSFISFDATTGQLEVFWETDFINQETTVRVFVKGTVTASWGDQFDRTVFFDLVLQLPDCSETSEEISLAIGSAIGEQFYMFGDGEKIIQVTEFSETTAQSCTPDDIVYKFEVKPDTSGQPTSFI
jgi:hypothetical protein